MNDTANQTKSRKLLVERLLLVGFLLLVLLLTFLYGNRVYDRFAAQAFVPDAEIERIHDQVAMTNLASDIFYASGPVIQSQPEFNQSCASTERTTAILGCYYSRKVYLYRVSNSEIKDAEAVTAAHEMLHAAYDRLLFFERSRIDKLINEQYELVKDDADIQKLMSYYKVAEPEALTNELHSILGTITYDLSPELEAYYKKYFHDRRAVVELNQNYNAVFAEIDQRARELNAKLDTLRPQIDQALQLYEQDYDQLQADIAVFNQQATGGSLAFRSFQAARNELLARIDSLNIRRTELNQQVAEYNQYVAQINALSIRVERLNEAINGVPEVETDL